MKRKGSLDRSTKLLTGSFLCQILRFFHFYFRNWFQTTIWKTMIPSHIIDHITTFNSFLFIPYIAILHENLYCFFYFSSAIWKSWKNYLLRQKKKSRTQFCTKWSETKSKWTTSNAVSFDFIWKHFGQKCVRYFFFWRILNFCKSGNNCHGQTKKARTMIFGENTHLGQLNSHTKICYHIFFHLAQNDKSLKYAIGCSWSNQRS